MSDDDEYEYNYGGTTWIHCFVLYRSKSTDSVCISYASPHDPTFYLSDFVKDEDIRVKPKQKAYPIMTSIEATNIKMESIDVLVTVALAKAYAYVDRKIFNAALAFDPLVDDGEQIVKIKVNKMLPPNLTPSDQSFILDEVEVMLKDTGYTFTSNRAPGVKLGDVVIEIVLN